jgi:hypothetical protein
VTAMLERAFLSPNIPRQEWGDMADGPQAVGSTVVSNERALLPAHPTPKFGASSTPRQRLCCHKVAAAACRLHVGWLATVGVANMAWLPPTNAQARGTSPWRPAAYLR